MGTCIDARLSSDKDNNNLPNNAANPQENQSQDVIKSSGIIVNGCGWIEGMGYELMKHSIQALNINVVLVMGHDRLYSLLSTHYNKLKDQKQKGDTSIGDNIAIPKVIKFSRSGGPVSRDDSFRHISKILSMKQYFYGESIVPLSTYQNAVSSTVAPIAGIPTTSSTSEGLSVATSSLVNKYSPSMLEMNFTDLKIYKISNVSLSASMLPVSAKQSSAAVQLTQITELSTSIEHSMLAVCHPVAVENYEQSGDESDLYMTAVTGFVVVEKVDMNREVISLLSPCTGSLASMTLLAADIAWRE